jgi:ribonuclease HI
MRTDADHPDWCFLMDEQVRRAHQKNPNYGNLEPRLFPFIQKLTAFNNMKSLSPEAKELLKATKKLNIQIHASRVDEKVKKQMPIWFHPKIKQNTRQDTRSKMSTHLRDTHATLTVGDALQITLNSLNPDHQPNNDCHCKDCKGERLITGCETPHSCATHALSLINKLDSIWRPRLPNEIDPDLSFLKESYTVHHLNDIFRILPLKTTQPPQTQIPTAPIHYTGQRLSIYTDGSCDGNGDHRAKAGSSIFYNLDDPRNQAIRVPLAYEQSNQTAELYAIKHTLETTDPHSELEILTDSKYAIDCLSTHTNKWENEGWFQTRNAPLIIETTEALRSRTCSTHLKWVKGHAGILGNKKVDELAKKGSELPQLEGPNPYTIKSVPPGAMLSKITQAQIYKELVSQKKTPKELTCTINIARIKSDLKLMHDHIPKTILIWKNLLCTKNIYHTQREFLYKTIKGGQLIGRKWLHSPNLAHRANCQTCDTVEDMEHILTKCSAPGQEIVWQVISQIWENKTDHWLRPSYGEILGCASIQIKTPENKINGGLTRLFQILVSEGAYLIWVLRCRRVIEFEDDPGKWPTKNNIITSLKHKINLRLRMDCIHTNNARFDRKAIRQSKMKKTWSGTLENEQDLPPDWPRSKGVLVGIRLDKNRIGDNDHG